MPIKPASSAFLSLARAARTGGNLTGGELSFAAPGKTSVTDDCEGCVWDVRGRDGCGAPALCGREPRMGVDGGEALNTSSPPPPGEAYWPMFRGQLLVRSVMVVSSLGCRLFRYLCRLMARMAATLEAASNVSKPFRIIFEPAIEG